MDNIITEKTNPETATDNLPKDLLHPGGTVERVMDYISATAICEQPLFALGAALTLCGLLYGRRYSDASGQRTNVFCIGVGYTSAGKDHALKALTRILSAGVFLEGYNAKLGGGRGSGVLSSTPVAYLIPAGQDRMRAPGTDGEEALAWNVIDQVIPAPYPVSAADLVRSDWFPSEVGETAGADAAARIRRYPSFRAYGGAEPDDAMLDAVRLTGRSVWNTRWLLIIPAGALHTDRETALDAFIDGVDTDRDGEKDISGVTDIRIGFKTYSHSGR